MSVFSNSNTSPLSENDRWILNYLTFLATGYALAGTMGFQEMQGIALQATAAVTVGVVMLKAMFVKQTPSDGRSHALLVLILLILAAVLNVMVSWKPLETLLRWTGWLVLVLSLSRIARASEGQWINPLIRRLPVLFFMLYLAYYIWGRSSDDLSALRSHLHMSGLYGNLILATGLFSPKLWQRVLWTIVGFVGIYLSGAGGALFTVPIMFVPFILYSTTSMPVKGITVALVLIFGATVFFQSQLFNRFLDIKLNISPTEESGFTGMDRLEHSKEERLALATYGISLAQRYPFGTGLGNTYADVSKEEIGMTHVHDGNVSLLIELGYPGFAIYTGVLLWIFLNILRNPGIDNQLKGFYFTYYFTFFGRSLSENYTMFDLGNFFNVVLLLLTASLFLCMRHGIAVRQPMMSRPGPMRMPPPRPPMRPRPAWGASAALR